MNAIFVAGTDTGVGKTLVTGLFARYLASRGISVVTQKWVETGARDGRSRDLAAHLKLMGRSAKDFGGILSLTNPYSFNFASSPHLASRLESKKIDAAKIKRSVERLSRRFDFVIIEGTGGLLVPIGDGKMGAVPIFLIDIVRDLKISVLLVAKNSLGAINHTLLSIEALQKRGIGIIGIVFNNISRCENDVVMRDNARIIGKLSRQTIIGELPSFDELRTGPEHVEGPRTRNLKLLHRKFQPLGARILTVIARRMSIECFPTKQSKL